LLLRFDAGAARSVARPGIAGPALTTSLPPVALLARGAVEHDDRLVRQHERLNAAAHAAPNDRSLPTA
jgi:hypothetical protein